MNSAARPNAIFPRALLLRAGLIWLGIATIFLISKWHAIQAFDLPDPDDTLRMVQLRDLIAGQGWFDLHQYRIDPPQGVLMHWSRLVDIPLLLVQLALRPLLGAALAEQAAMVIVPMLTLGAALLLVARLAWRLFDLDLVPYACVVLVLATPVTAQLDPLRIDHHGWQIVCALAALNAIFARDARKGGWAAGLATAAGMTISLEILPLAALLGGALALRWLIDPRQRWWLVHFMAALVGSGAVLFLATRGLSDLANHCDSFSPAYLAALAVATAGLAGLAMLPALPRPALLIGMALCGAAALATVLTIAPECRAGPFAALDPLVRQYWYANVPEGMPVWNQKLPVLAQMVVPPLIGLIVALRLWLRGKAGSQWRDYAVVMAGALLLGVMVARSSSFSCAFAAVPLGWQLREWRGRAERLSTAPKRIGAMLAMAMIVMPGLPLIALVQLIPAQKAVLASNEQSPQRACTMAAAAPTLNRLPPQTILAPIDIGPLLLAQTHHSVVATGHHRAQNAIHDLIAAFIAAPDKARPILARHGVRYVMICPGVPEVSNYSEAGPKGLMAALAANRPPAWLQPVTLPEQSGLKMWQVVQ